jgi:hypothetical protein
LFNRNIRNGSQQPTGEKPCEQEKLKPGQGGTKSLLDNYSERLICVRYHYD